MKTLNYWMIGVAACLFVQTKPLAAQNSVATFAKEATSSLADLLDRADKDGFVMEARTTTIFGGWLPKGAKTGNEKWISILVATNLNPNRQYRVIGAGDNDTRDLDLRVLDPAGKVVVEDNWVARNPGVTFKPERQQDYTIQMRLWDSRDNCICIGAILTK